MKMPDAIGDRMLAPCGMNCEVCYKHVGMPKRGQPCAGCLVGGQGKTARCRTCHIKTCAEAKGHVHCFACADFPCKLLKNMEKSYTQRYRVSLLENSRAARTMGVSAFLAEDRERWRCACGGAFSLHDGRCSECGKER